MSIHERLRRARIAAGYGSASDAARAFDMNINSLISNENGNAPYGRDAALRYARAFGVSVDWLLTGKGPMRPSRRGVKVVGVVGAGAVIAPIDDGSFDPVIPPFGTPEGAVAFVVRGDSMWPRYDDGDVIIAMPVTSVDEVVGRRAVVTLTDETRLLKTVQPGAAPGTYDLHSHNAPPMLGAVIVAAARVLGSVEN